MARYRKTRQSRSRRTYRGGGRRRYSAPRSRGRTRRARSGTGRTIRIVLETGGGSLVQRPELPASLIGFKAARAPRKAAF